VAAWVVVMDAGKVPPVPTKIPSVTATSAAGGASAAATRGQQSTVPTTPVPGATPATRAALCRGMGASTWAALCAAWTAPMQMGSRNSGSMNDDAVDEIARAHMGPEGALVMTEGLAAQLMEALPAGLHIQPPAGSSWAAVLGFSRVSAASARAAYPAKWVAPGAVLAPVSLVLEGSHETGIKCSSSSSSGDAAAPVCHVYFQGLSISAPSVQGSVAAAAAGSATKPGPRLPQCVVLVGVQAVCVVGCRFSSPSGVGIHCTFTKQQQAAEGAAAAATGPPSLCMVACEATRCIHGVGAEGQGHGLLLLKRCRLAGCTLGVQASSLEAAQLECCTMVGCIEGMAAGHSSHLCMQFCHATGCGGWKKGRAGSKGITGATEAGTRVAQALMDHYSPQPAHDSSITATPNQQQQRQQGMTAVEQAAGRRPSLRLKALKNVRLFGCYVSRSWGPSLALIDCEDVGIRCCNLGAPTDTSTLTAAGSSSASSGTSTSIAANCSSPPQNSSSSTGACAFPGLVVWCAPKAVSLPHLIACVTGPVWVLSKEPRLCFMSCVVPAICVPALECIGGISIPHTTGSYRPADPPAGALSRAAEAEARATRAAMAAKRAAEGTRAGAGDEEASGNGEGGGSIATFYTVGSDALKWLAAAGCEVDACFPAVCAEDLMNC